MLQLLSMVLLQLTIGVTSNGVERSSLLPSLLHRLGNGVLLQLLWLQKGGMQLLFLLPLLLLLHLLPPLVGRKAVLRHLLAGRKCADHHSSATGGKLSYLTLCNVFGRSV
uniref:DUF3778 domain-containing protein n=1 Tax=Oryza glumipatula TaxID=40148 RepID=A0A0D9Z8M7_9ORYZ